MAEKPELAPCPFDGGKDIEVEMDDCDGQTSDFFFATHKRCSAKGPEADTEGEAGRLWNQRVQ